MTAQFANFFCKENDLDDDDGSTHLFIEHHDDFACVCFVLLVIFFLPGNESETSVIVVWPTAAYK